jgi:hypothetical protein
VQYSFHRFKVKWLSLLPALLHELLDVAGVTFTGEIPASAPLVIDVVAAMLI